MSRVSSLHCSSGGHRTHFTRIFPPAFSAIIVTRAQPSLPGLHHITASSITAISHPPTKQHPKQPALIIASQYTNTFPVRLPWMLHMRAGKACFVSCPRFSADANVRGGRGGTHSRVSQASANQPRHPRLPYAKWPKAMPCRSHHRRQVWKADSVRQGQLRRRQHLWYSTRPSHLPYCLAFQVHPNHCRCGSHRRSDPAIIPGVEAGGHNNSVLGGHTPEGHRQTV